MGVLSTWRTRTTVPERGSQNSKACNGVTRSWVQIPPPPLVVVRERSLSGRWRTTPRTLIVVRLVACGEEMGSRAPPLIGPAHRSRGRWIDLADCSALAQRSCARPSVPALAWETGQGAGGVPVWADSVVVGV